MPWFCRRWSNIQTLILTDKEAFKDVKTENNDRDKNDVKGTFVTEFENF